MAKHTHVEHYNSQTYLSNISLDCVIFGFHENELKVLLLKLRHSDCYALPGGFLHYEETVEDAGERILKLRTGLDNIFLKQFNVYSDPKRSELNPTLKEMVRLNPNADVSFFESRFISIGLFALLEYTLVKPTPDELSTSCDWVSIDQIENTMLDHADIIKGALKTLRKQINYTPIGYNLLPQKFTMPEMQSLYETILGKKLDRRNFQRKMNAYNILNKLDEKREGVAHKAPFLYEFNQKNYEEALKNGFNNSW